MSEQNNFETASPEILERIAKTRELTRAYAQTDYRDKEGRQKILKELFGSIGTNVAVDSPIHCDHGDNIHIGDNVIIGMNCTFVDNEKITIGNNVLIASNVQIYTSTHPLARNERINDKWQEEKTTWFRTSAAPVSIGDDSWIGGGVIILSGVKIGKNVVVGAGAVVTRDIPDNSLALGIPAKVVKQID